MQLKMEMPGNETIVNVILLIIIFTTGLGAKHSLTLFKASQLFYYRNYRINLFWVDFPVCCENITTMIVQPYYVTASTDYTYK